MEEQKTHAKNRQVERIRGWIWEALMKLMDEVPYEKITVADLTEKAGIARQTFYYNYKDKDDVVFQKLDPCFGTRLEGGKSGARKQIVVILNRTCIEENREIIKRFMTIPSIIYRVEQAFFNTPAKLSAKRWEGQSDEEYEISRFKVGYQIAGVLRIIIDWFTDGMKMPAEKLVALLNSMANPREARYRNVPVVEVRVE
jgi:AcrR family transcriptional regulator